MPTLATDLTFTLPFYKFLFCFIFRTTAMDVLFEKMYNNASTRGENVVTAEDAVKSETSNYSSDLSDVNTNPLLWWKSHDHTYTHLAELARRRLTSPGTSVPSERLFSAAGNLVSAKRNCLLSNNIDMLLFLNKNMN